MSDIFRISLGSTAGILSVCCLAACYDSVVTFVLGVIVGVGLSYQGGPHVRLAGHVMHIITTDAIHTLNKKL
jgi:hypothetical protein